jgi:hypothetical protein
MTDYGKALPLTDWKRIETDPISRHGRKGSSYTFPENRRHLASSSCLGRSNLAGEVYILGVRLLAGGATRGATAGCA